MVQIGHVGFKRVVRSGSIFICSETSNEINEHNWSYSLIRMVFAMNQNVTWGPP
jgi:hypothetical protein